MISDKILLNTNTPFNMRWTSVVFLAFVIVLSSCAVQSPISGGEKDVTPPVPLGSTPENFSTGFKDQRIIITFNEFITLKDIDKQVLISPPVEKAPKFKIRGKSLIISFEEPLQKEATYNIFFGSAITDLTEGNALTDYSFVFSTGNQLDSLEIAGKVYQAFDLQPPKEALAMLYDKNNDSLPYLSRPFYLSRINADGGFRIGNLREGHFKMIVLEDLNGNYLYDRGESIAFTDSLITANKPEIPKHDSVGKTIVVEEKNVKIPSLAFFRESDSVQRVLKASLVAPNHLLLSFKLGVKKPLLSVPGKDIKNDWYLLESNTTGDTLNCWLKNISGDSLRFVVNDGSQVIDTINISLEFKTKESRKVQREGVVEKLQIRSNAPRQGNFPLNSPFVLLAGNPLAKADFKSIMLVEGVDTLFPGAMFSDNLNHRITVNRLLVEGKKYQLIVPDSAFEDIYGHLNDSIKMQFNTRLLSDYGSLIMNVKVTDAQPYVIQLFTEAGKLVKEERIDSDKKLTFSFLLPGKYKLKAIVDKNHNGKWDTGNYLGHLQPEMVINYKTVIDLRANWEQEEEWQLKIAIP
ncbi:MAG: Ig-like domain-containing protein [Bacteroidales bacterium]